MKLLLLFSLVLLPTILFSQGATCAGMDPICTDVGANFTANTGTTAEPGNNYGCLITQPNPSWYYFEIATNGNIDMSLTAGSDIDFIIWGPYANLAAAQANCGSLGAGNQVDCSYSSTNNETPSIPNAQVGEVYIMLITNYASVVQDVTLTQTGGTGSTDCDIVNNPPCFMNYFEASVGACDAGTGTYEVTGTIEFDNPPATGDLIVVDCDGNQVIVASAPFAVNAQGEGLENFTLAGLDPDGLGCSVTAYFFDDPTCSLSLNYTAPECLCFISYMSVNQEPCDVPSGTFSLSGFIEFESPPTTGVLTISDCNGNTNTFSPPFVSPQNFALTGITPDGTTNCTITAQFSEDPTCVFDLLTYNHPANCDCPVDAGSFTATITGNTTNSYELCFGDSFTLTPNGDFIPPDDIGDDGTFTYNPGMWYLIYDCPPSIQAPNDIFSDTCLLGAWDTSTPFGPWTVDNVFGDNNTYYFVPVTFYDYVNGVYSYFFAGTLCYDTGNPYPITFLEPIVENTVEDCFAGTATTTVSGGAPAFNGSNFTVVPGSLSPASASFDNTSAPNGGTITISGLLDGDAYSYDIQDVNGCPITVSGIFQGMQDATFSYNFKYCQDEPNPLPVITGVAGGTFSATPAGLVINPFTGLINLAASTPGTYTVQYVSPAATCWGTETFVLSVNPLPLVVPTEDSPICDDGVSTIQLGETGGEATEWLWSSSGGATITATTDQNPVVSNATNGEVFTVQVTNVNTGCTNSAQIAVTVTPMEDPTFSLTDFCEGAANSATITGTAGGTFAFNPAPGDGATINASTGEISNEVGGTTYSIEYTTPGVCFDSSIETVTVNSTPTVDPIADIEECAGTAISVAFTGAVAGTQYNWTNTNTGIGLGANGTGDIASFNGVNAGAAPIVGTVTVTPTANGCVGTPEDFTITINPLEDATFTLTDYCEGAANSATIVGSAGGTFAFNPAPGDGATINGVTGEITNGVGGTTYTVEYTTAGVCFDVSTETVTVNPTPTVDPIADIAECAGTAISVAFTGAVAGTQYNWINTNTGIGLGANGTGDIASFNGVNAGAAPIVGTVTVTPTANGCVGTPEDFTITINPLEDATFTLTDYCEGAANSATIVGSAGGTFAFNPAPGDGATINGATGEITNGVGGTTYTVEYTTAGVCFDTSTETVTVNPLDDATFTLTDFCEGAVNAATITGTAGGTFAFNPAPGDGATINGTTGEITNGIGGTNYSVEYTTAGICPQSSIENVTVNPLGDPTFTLVDFCEGEVNAANITGDIGGTFIFNPAPGDGATVNGATGEISNEVGGTTYTVEYTTAGLCPQSSTENVTVNPNPTPVIVGDLEYCQGTSATVSADAVYTTYNWSTGDNTQNITVTIADNPITLEVTNGFGCTGTSPNYNVAENNVLVYNSSLEICQGESIEIHGNMESVAGVYSATFPLPNGCDSTANVTLVVNPLPVVNAGADVTLCNGEFTVLQGTGADSYAWDNGLGVGNNFNVSPVTTTTYEVTGTDANGCVNTDQVTVTVNPLPTASIAGTTSICENDASPNITITGANGTAPYTFTYNINGGTDIVVGSAGNDAVISVPNSPAGTYTYNIVSVEDASATNCSQAQVGSATVTINPNPTPAIVGDIDYCEGFTATISADAVYTTYDWSTGANTQSIDVTAADNPITLTVTNGFGCSGISGAYNVIENPTPIVDAGNDVTICVGSQTTLSATGAVTYVWDNGLGAGNNFDVSPAVNTTYTVVGTDANGCVGTDDMEVIVNDPPTATIDGTATLCENDPSPSVTFTGANGTAPYIFTYTINGGPDLTVNSGAGNDAVIVVPNNPAGTYVYDLVHVEESSANNCGQDQVGSVTITINGLPNVIAGTDIVACDGDEVTLNASGAVDYVWDNGVTDGVPFTPVNGIYTVTGIDANGCENSDDVLITVSPVPVPSFDVDVPICEPFIVTLTNTTPGVSANCVWQLTGQTPINGCGPITLTLADYGAYDVTLTTSNAAGCSASVTELDAFTLEESPNAAFSPPFADISSLNTEVNFINNSTGATSYEWHFGDGTANSNATNPSHTYPDESGYYSVMLVATSNSGCVDTAYGNIRVRLEVIYYVPNTFTPDNDSHNQFFKPVFTSGYDPYDYTLLIFNRWGEIVFESHDVDRGWDGTYAGNYVVQDGTYTWKIEFKTIETDERVMDIGHVNVLR